MIKMLTTRQSLRNRKQRRRLMDNELKFKNKIQDHVSAENNQQHLYLKGDYIHVQQQDRSN
ncbi:MAG: hypothetical protein A4E53_00746 [Pelotomaculum sp. PtaB.Bin104]|nr:MAG: hypothetical protein A4E53_00746 [Pelotomaculum sp. PtaB.Bin104]